MNEDGNLNEPSLWENELQETDANVISVNETAVGVGQSPGGISTGVANSRATNTHNRRDALGECTTPNLLSKISKREADEMSDFDDCESIEPNKIFFPATSLAHGSSMVEMEASASTNNVSQSGWDRKIDAASMPSSLTNSTELSDKGFEPSKWDVICGRGKQGINHVGNRRFKLLIATSLPKYIQAKSRDDKSFIINAIVNQVREASPNGGFVKQDSEGKWYDIGVVSAREKVAHAFRDSMPGPLKVIAKSNSKEKNIEVKKAQKAIFQSCNIQFSETNQDSDRIP